MQQMQQAAGSRQQAGDKQVCQQDTVIYLLWKIHIQALLLALLPKGLASLSKASRQGWLKFSSSESFAAMEEEEEEEEVTQA
ncbi:hypothetical protein STEG23_019015 [Scotinomys teguina]